MSTDPGTSDRRLRPNLVLINMRERRGWGSRRRAARELHRIWCTSKDLPGAPDVESIEKTLYRHETGRVQVRDDAYRRLYCLAYEASPHELFGSVEHEGGQRGEYTMRSHKFIPIYVGADAAALLATDPRMQACTEQWLTCHTMQVAVINGRCEMHVWPFGVVIYHLVEELALPSLAALSVWRLQSYKDNMVWAAHQLRALLGGDAAEASYVLSAYWVREPAWTGDELDTALRILCIPKVLLERNADPDDALAHAELVERALLVDGFEHPETVPFGIKGISAGYASWSGVVYHPTAEQRALAEEDLVACELAVQALWSYCDHLNQQVEQGLDPVVPPDYGWRFLRAVRSRLNNARPQESEQHRSMRTAILATCGIVNHLAHAIDTLRETDGG